MDYSSAVPPLCQSYASLAYRLDPEKSGRSRLTRLHYNIIVETKVRREGKRQLRWFSAIIPDVVMMVGILQCEI